jgi:hypothetical protein
MFTKAIFPGNVYTSPDPSATVARPLILKLDLNGTDIAYVPVTN